MGCGNFSSVTNSSFWIISDSTYSSIHRFFDSSPFSPSGKYLGYSRTLVKEGTDLSDGKSPSEVVVVNLYTKEVHVVDRTTAWDTQVGAHVQWGVNDSQLFYNQYQPSDTLFDASSSSPTSSIPSLKGVMANIFTSKKVYFDSPVYHVSPLGDYYASPDLTKIRFTQLGYGVHSSLASPNTNASQNDGVFVINIVTGKSNLLVSLYDLAITAGFNPSTPTYAFHIKWSSDGAYLMIVARTQEPRVLSTWVDRVRHTIGTKRQWFRRQHLFVVESDGRNLRYITSWQSEPSYSQANQHALRKCDDEVMMRLMDILKGSMSLMGNFSPPQCLQIPSRRSATLNKPLKTNLHHNNAIIRDGNHPNWIPGTHKISMNMQDIIDSTRRNAHRSDTYQYKSNKVAISKRYKIVIFDLGILANSSCTNGSTLSSIPLQFDSFIAAWRRNTIFFYHASSGVLQYQVYPLGSGHPTFSALENGRLLLTDTYSKELPSLPIHRNIPNNTPSSPHCAPLRLIDTFTQQEKHLLNFQIDHTHAPVSKYDKLARSWRCDMHPAWSRDHQWVAVNARAKGGNRQVLVGYLGTDLTTQFNEAE